MQFAHLLDFFIAIAAGAIGGMLFAWSLNRRCYRLELDFQDLAETLFREKKKRAAQARWQGDDEFSEILKAAKTPSEEPKQDLWGWAKGRDK